MPLGQPPRGFFYLHFAACSRQIEYAPYLQRPANTVRQSVVGFKTDSVGRNSRICQAPTFAKVDGTTLTLKDLTLVGGTNPSTGKPIALTRANNNIKFFGSDGNMQLIKNDTTLEAFNKTAFDAYKSDTDELQFVYVDAQKHWFLYQDSGYTYPMDDYPLEAGRGYLLFANNALGYGAKMTDSGSVRDEKVEVNIGRNSRTMAGNIAPCDMKLKEFTLTSGLNPSTGKPIAFTRANNNIKFFGADGNMQLLKNETDLETFCKEAYDTFKSDTDELQFVFVEAKAHWYLYQDSGYLYPMDEYVIKAGRGMIPFAGNALGFGMTFTMPPAIQKPVEVVEE